MSCILVFPSEFISPQSISLQSLHSQEDIKAFYDGLLMNLDLYFKKFEDEIQPSVTAPETAAPAAPEAGDMDLDDIANM